MRNEMYDLTKSSRRSIEQIWDTYLTLVFTRAVLLSGGLTFKIVIEFVIS